MKRYSRMLVLLSAVALVAAACSAGAPDTPPTTDAPTTTTTEADDHGDDHGHDDGDVDPSAPVYAVEASEFAFSPDPIEVEGETFTIELSNDGVVEHDMVIEGAEDQGGSHLQPGESGSVSYTLEPGTYIVYCTVPGHRDAGMEGTLVISADDHADDDHGDHEDDHVTTTTAAGDDHGDHDHDDDHDDHGDHEDDH